MQTAQIRSRNCLQTGRAIRLPPAAQRCALTAEESIKTCSGGPPAEANYIGRTEEAIEWALKAMRINPHHPEWYIMQLGPIYYDAHRYQDAIETIESLRNFETIWTDFYLAASHAQLGHQTEARQALQGALKFDPQATIEGWITSENVPYKDPSYAEHLREGLRDAGLPER